MKEHRERELKFDVPAGWVFPEIEPLLPPGGTVETVLVRLQSTYFDTAAHDLLHQRVTLRKRVGDADTGWQLKLPDGNARTEVTLPLDGRGLPAELRLLVTGLRAGAPLHPVATITTRRNVYRVLAGDGTVVAEIADDDVTSATLGDSTTVDAWREVEVELVDGDEQYLKQARKHLRAAGAVPAASASKLARALGAGADRKPAGTGSLFGLVRGYLDAQYDAIVGGDLDLRRGLDAIHRTRVATRRYRSVLHVFGGLLDAERVAALDTELRWYAQLLGTVRDRQVLRAHLDEAVRELPPENVLGPVAARIEQTLDKEAALAQQALSRAMAGRRYSALLRELRAWREAPPFTHADRRARAVEKYLTRADRKVGERLAAVAHAAGEAAALHRVRKAGKRARYVAELAEPVLGAASRAAVKRGKRVQDRLGVAQDSVVAAEFLRRMGAAAGTAPGENGFTYGLLWEREQQRAAAARDAVLRR